MDLPLYPASTSRTMLPLARQILPISAPRFISALLRPTLAFLEHLLHNLLLLDQKRPHDTILDAV